MKILGIAGRKGHGKDSVAKILEEQGWTVVAFADELKRLAMGVFGLSPEEVFGGIEVKERPLEKMKDETLQKMISFGKSAYPEMLAPIFTRTNPIDAGKKMEEFVEEILKEPVITSRLILQQMGTEFGRKLDPDVWVRRVQCHLGRLSLGGFAYNRYTGMRSVPGLPAPPGAAISDVRFENEASAIRGWGGKTLWVDARKRLGDLGSGEHASEPTREEALTWCDGEIDNNGTLEDLKGEVGKFTP